MKKCGGCNVEYPAPYELNFYKAEGSKDGFMRSCKACRKASTLKYRIKHADKIREKKRAQYNDPNKEDSRKRYLKTEIGKAKLKASQKKWVEKNPERYALYSKVKWAIQKGTIKKQPCGVCSNSRASFYHYDYSMPLDVYWRCFKCKNIVDNPLSQCLNHNSNNSSFLGEHR